MIACGWCGQATEPGRCGNCHRDPALPWTQRAMEPPRHDPLEKARRALGPDATVAQVAEYLDVSDRTVRRWQRDVRPLA